MLFVHSDFDCGNSGWALRSEAMPLSKSEDRQTLMQKGVGIKTLSAFEVTPHVIDAHALQR